jgi:hypothetical protein
MAAFMESLPHPLKREDRALPSPEEHIAVNAVDAGFNLTVVAKAIKASCSSINPVTGSRAAF